MFILKNHSYAIDIVHCYLAKDDRQNCKSETLKNKNNNFTFVSVEIHTNCKCPKLLTDIYLAFNLSNDIPGNTANKKLGFMLSIYTFNFL